MIKYDIKDIEILHKIFKKYRILKALYPILRQYFNIKRSTLYHKLKKYNKN
jgi:transcriptional regulator of acetoin/glycerol metabolism